MAPPYPHRSLSRVLWVFTSFLLSWPAFSEPTCPLFPDSHAPRSSHRGEFVATSPGDFFTFHGSERGPSIFLLSGLHGDERSGPEALFQLVRGWEGKEKPMFTLKRGTVTVLPVANVAAFKEGARTRQSPPGRDFNRSFSDCSGGTAGDDECQRVGEILQLARRMDLVLDFHEAGPAWEDTPLSALVITPAAAEVALELKERLEADGSFALSSGSPAGSLGYELADAGKGAITVEISRKLPFPSRVALIHRLIQETLLLLSMVDRVE